jgi:diadenosine tetraphosphatase ApaH/serine/threonine PP2A family protein phosphatase
MGVTLIYGHTPSEDLSVRWNAPFSIGIDTGAVYGGPLTAIRLPDERIFQV